MYTPSRSFIVVHLDPEGIAQKTLINAAIEAGVKLVRASANDGKAWYMPGEITPICPNLQRAIVGDCRTDTALKNGRTPMVCWQKAGDKQDHLAELNIDKKVTTLSADGRICPLFAGDSARSSTSSPGYRVHHVPAWTVPGLSRRSWCHMRQNIFDPWRCWINIPEEQTGNRRRGSSIRADTDHDPGSGQYRHKGAGPREVNGPLVAG